VQYPDPVRRKPPNTGPAPIWSWNRQRSRHRPTP